MQTTTQNIKPFVTYKKRQK